MWPTCHGPWEPPHLSQPNLLSDQMDHPVHCSYSETSISTYPAGADLRLREAAVADRDAAPGHHLHLLHDRARRGAGRARKDPEGLGAPQAPQHTHGVAGSDRRVLCRRRGGALLVPFTGISFRLTELLNL